ncbi:NAD(P)H-dependent oxidoreductase subunit E [Clostridiaceae bacterium 35-E11]
MIIKVCVGTACHLNGSYDIIHRLQELIEKHELGEKISVNPVFCLGECGTPVSVDIDDGEIYSVTGKNIESFFVNTILPRIHEV